jgi:chromosome segregation ATPase
MFSFLKKTFTNSDQNREAACELFQSMLREKKQEMSNIKQEIKALDSEKQRLLAELERVQTRPLSGGGCTSVEEKELEFEVQLIDDTVQILKKNVEKKKKEIDSLTKKLKRDRSYNTLWEKELEKEKEEIKPKRQQMVEAQKKRREEAIVRQTRELEERYIQEQELEKEHARLMEEIKLKQNLLHGTQLTEAQKETLQENIQELQTKIRNLDPYGEEGKFMGGKSRRNNRKSKGKRRTRRA